MWEKIYKIQTNQLLLSALSITLFWACDTKKELEQENVNYCLKKEFEQKIELQPIKKREVTELLSLSGSIQYNADDVVAVKSKLDGTVDKVLVTLGQYVKKGEVLAEIASAELNEIWLEKQHITQNLALAQQKVKTAEALLADGLASQRQVEEARMEYAVLQSSLQTQNQHLSYVNASSKKGIFQILAPKSGYIVEKSITPGMLLSKDQDVMFAISNLDEVWVMVNVYANHLSFVTKGSPVKVKTLAYPNISFDGVVAHVSHVFDQEERVLKARVVLDNQKLLLKPGMSADILLEKNTLQDSMLAIPNNAILFDNNQKYVIVYQNKCDMKIRRVVPFTENAEYTFVKEGFTEGEKVITENELLIFEELKK